MNVWGILSRGCRTFVECSREVAIYTIRWVASRLGVTPGTLRAWEQRYGIVEPGRTEAGYRVYDEDDLVALTQMARLVADGVRPAQAAQQVLSGRSRPVSPVNPSPTAPGLPDPASLIAASRTFDSAALASALDSAFSAAGFEFVVDGWLTDALRQVGQAWVEGRLDAAQEHFISAGIMRRLGAAFDAAGQPRTGRHVLVGLVPGATHEIASLAFATVLRRAGLRVTYLGPDLPVASWVEAVRVNRPDAVVLGAPTYQDAAAAAEVIAALAETASGLLVYVGGRGAPPGHSLPGTLAGAGEALAQTLTHP